MEKGTNNYPPVSNNSLRKAFGLVVSRERRKRLPNQSQRAFAASVPISNSHLRKIEKGDMYPALQTINNIAAMLGTNAAYLVNEACKLAYQMELDEKSNKRNAGRSKPCDDEHRQINSNTESDNDNTDNTSADNTQAKKSSRLAINKPSVSYFFLSL